MIVRLARIIAAAIGALLGLAFLLALPVLLIETSCRPAGTPAPYDPILPEAHHRPESRTLLTYPEWHIVHAYEDYARVLRDGDPHEYDFLRGITGFWTSLCDLSRAAGAHGGFPGETKTMVYVVGVSFTLELLAKAAYEETLGRAATWIRGSKPAPLDTLSAEQARDYAIFLRQVPWYRWDFPAAAKALSDAATPVFRDRERALALGLEYRGKALYADAIAAAVAATGQDALQLRMIVSKPPEPRDGLQIIATRDAGVEIETVRYRALTSMLQDLAREGIDFVEIAGSDDIMLSVLSDSADHDGSLLSMPRQGFSDYRHLLLVNVDTLAERLRRIEATGARVEHIHDY